MSLDATSVPKWVSSSRSFLEGLPAPYSGTMEFDVTAAIAAMTLRPMEVATSYISTMESS